MPMESLFPAPDANHLTLLRDWPHAVLALEMGADTPEDARRVAELLPAGTPAPAGSLPGLAALSPTSQAMVAASDRLVAIGGVMAPVSAVWTALSSLTASISTWCKPRGRTATTLAGCLQVSAHPKE